MASLLWSIWVIVWLSLENSIQTHADLSSLLILKLSNFLTHQQSQTERKQHMTLSAVSI